MWDIHGFDERMIHGWHHDSNVCKRLYLYYGNRTESLAHRLKGYHCDHVRVASPIHWVGRKMENDLQQYVFGVTDPIAHHQADTWGAPDEPIEEVDFADSPAARFIGALERTLGEPQRGRHCRRQQRGAEFRFLQRTACADATRRQFHGLPAGRALCLRRQ